jgi:hypothetical protein
MTPHLKADAAAAFYDRRSPDRDPDDGAGFWLRRIKISELLSGLALLGALLSALGWRYYSPERAIAALEARISHNTVRIDSLANGLAFTNYLQCVQLRKTDPSSLPPNCAPIIERGARP